MSHYILNTTPDTTQSFNFLHTDGRPFNELDYIADTATAYKTSMVFALRRAAQYGASAEYHLEQYHRAMEARKQALIDAGELALSLCRARDAYRQIKAGGAQ